MSNFVKVILCRGIPASGKSTWAKEQVRKEPGKWKRVNRDDIREMIDGGVYSPSNEKVVLKVRDLVIQEAVKRGVNVIIDDTNIKDKGKNFRDICSLVESLDINAQVMEKNFYIDLEEAIARDAKRANPVGEKVINLFWGDSGKTHGKSYNPRIETILVSNAGLDNKGVKFDPKLPRAIMVDLDGTLALLNGRNPYDASRCEEDLPNIPVVETVKSMYAQGCKIIFCSGREDRYQTGTLAFIKKHLPELEYVLFMRKSGDRRKDAIIKNEIFRREIEGKYNVLFVLDDRNQVVEQWRKIGLTCFQVAPGNF